MSATTSVQPLIVRQFNADGTFRHAIAAVRRTPAPARIAAEGHGEWLLMNAKGEYLTMHTAMLDGKNPGWRDLPLVPRAIAIAISPSGEEFFDGYGPLTKKRAEATDFVDAGVAAKAIMNRFGRGDRGFWNSERMAAERAEKQYRGWTFRVENVPAPA